MMLGQLSHIRKVMTNLMRGLSMGAVIALQACGLTGPDVDALGTVRFVDVEGGCWVIETETERYEPINLELELQREGMEVFFQAELRPDLASVCQVGVLVELTNILSADPPVQEVG